MKLILLKEKNLIDSTCVRKLSYGNFQITVTVDENVSIVAESKYSEILAVNEQEAHMSTISGCFGEDDIDDVIMDLQDAKDLIVLINKSRELFTGKEN